MQSPQHTLASSVSLSGIALFSGRAAVLTLKPAPINHGVVFARMDLNGATVPALISRVVRRPRRTAIKCGSAVVETIEHVMSALAALGVDNALCEVDGSEVPLMDGSAAAFVPRRFARSVLAAQDAPRKVLVVTEPIMVRDGDAVVAILPSPEPGAQFTYELDMGPLGRQAFAFNLTADSFAKEVAPARTFSAKAEAEAAFAAGAFKHLTVDDALVLDEAGKPMGKNALRFDNEPVRHKLLDLIGDEYLLGAPIQGRVVAVRSGHALNHVAARRLSAQLRRQDHAAALVSPAEIDIRGLFQMMPHRYPMLMVDRVLEIDGDKRAVGVKNVTINEPFFQGHYPTNPIMPGVLILEALAQMAGVLLGQHAENVGKLPLLLSLDRVKLRKPVTPGDQLILEAEAVRVRKGMAHMRCRAYVAEELAAEAEIKFMLLDKPPA